MNTYFWINLLMPSTIKVGRGNVCPADLNIVSKTGITNIIKIIHRDGAMEDHPLMDKSEAADVILDRVKDIMARRRN